MEPGEQFEKDFAREFGLERVPNSGSSWHSKLDVVGAGARWSLKYRANSLRIDRDLIDEATSATLSLSGTGEIPMWAIRLGSPEYDLILMRKEDFKLLQAGELEVLPEKRTKTAIRTRLSEIPSLLRDDDGA